MAGVIDGWKDQFSGQAQFGRFLVVVADVVQVQLLGESADRIVGRSGGHSNHNVRAKEVG